MNKQYSRILQHQKGLTTLAIVLILLFVATLVTLYTANSTVREQQVSANQYRADQALSAANAALDYAVAYYSKHAGPDAPSETNGDGDGVVDYTLGAPLTVSSTFLSGQDLTVSAEFYFLDAAGGTDAFVRPHTIVATGFSDDLSATRTIEVQVDSFGLVPGGGLPGFPLISRGIADEGGNFKIINRFSHATIWAGDEVPIGSDADTYVYNPADPADLNDHDEMVGYSVGTEIQVLYATYKQGGVNSDVLDNDNNLANMAPDEFFQNFMIEDKPTVKSYAESIDQRFDAENSQDFWNSLTVSEGVRGLVWIDVADGGDWAPTGNLSTLGTEQNPITLIINGDFTAGGGGGHELDVIGMIYVIGDWYGGSNFEVQGGMIIEGATDNNGTPTIVYDQNLYDGSLGNPPGNIVSVIAGTWKDW